MKKNFTITTQGVTMSGHFPEPYSNTFLIYHNCKRFCVVACARRPKSKIKGTV
jgi:hypothetical protein